MSIKTQFRKHWRILKRDFASQLEVDLLARLSKFTERVEVKKHLRYLFRGIRSVMLVQWGSSSILYFSCILNFRRRKALLRPWSIPQRAFSHGLSLVLKRYKTEYAEMKSTRVQAMVHTLWWVLSESPYTSSLIKILAMHSDSLTGRTNTIELLAFFSSSRGVISSNIWFSILIMMLIVETWTPEARVLLLDLNDRWPTCSVLTYLVMKI